MGVIDRPKVVRLKADRRKGEAFSLQLMSLIAAFSLRFRKNAEDIGLDRSGLFPCHEHSYEKDGLWRTLKT